MLATKFVYDLLGRPAPKDEELEDEIERLLYLRGVGEPNHIESFDETSNRDHHLDTAPSKLDAEVFKEWIKRRFEPALILLLLDSEDNYYYAKSELVKMKGYETQVDKLLRVNFTRRHAIQRIREMCFDDPVNLKVPQVVDRLKRTLTFLSRHLEQRSPANLTLLNTNAYTVADVTLYSYLKRIVVGRYRDFGLKSHVKLCDTLLAFMQEFRRKNPRVGSIPDDGPEKPSLVSDIAKPAVVAAIVVMFYLWRKS